MDSRGEASTVRAATRQAEIAAARPLLAQLTRLHLDDAALVDAVVDDTLAAALARAGDGALLDPEVLVLLRQRIVAALGPVPAGAGETAASSACPVYDWQQTGPLLDDPRFMAVLSGCVSALPAPQARVLLLREWHGLAPAAICGALGLSDTQCTALLREARFGLMTLLQQRWFAATAAA